MKKKITTIAWLFILIAVFCSACGNTDNAADTSQDSTTESTEMESPEDKKTAETEPKAKEENLYGEKTLDEIKEDLGTSEIMMDFGTDEDYYISDITLIKRNTKEESDNVFCTITVNGDTRQFIQDFELIYNHYTTGGWILDEYTATNEQTILPLAGVDDYTVSLAISQYIDADCSYEIEGHETDLNSMSDSFSVSVSLDRNLYHISGSLFLSYLFNGEFWELMNISEESDYMEIWDVDGTWILDESEGDTGYIHILQFWHNDDMTISGNKYSIGYTFGRWHDEVPKDFDNVTMDFNTGDGYIEVENAATYVAKLDEDGIYRTVWGFPDDKSHVYEKVSANVLSIEEIKNLISLQ